MEDSWWLSCECCGLLSSGLVKPHPYRWRIFGGERTCALAYQERDHWSAMTQVVAVIEGKGGWGTCAMTRRVGRAKRGWFLGDHRCMRLPWRVSF